MGRKVAGGGRRPNVSHLTSAGPTRLKYFPKQPHRAALNNYWVSVVLLCPWSPITRINYGSHPLIEPCVRQTRPLSPCLVILVDSPADRARCLLMAPEKRDCSPWSIFFFPSHPTDTISFWFEAEKAEPVTPTLSSLSIKFQHAQEEYSERERHDYALQLQVPVGICSHRIRSSSRTRHIGFWL